MTSSDLFAKAFSNLQTATLLIERSTGRISEANRAFLGIAGRSREEVLGGNFWAPPFIDDAEAGQEVFGHLLTGGSVQNAQLPMQTASGCLLIEISGAPLDSSVVQLEVWDATARAAERVAARMDAQRSLGARVAREFTYLHGALQSASELLSAAARRGDVTFQQGDEIRKAAGRAAAIGGDLMAYSGELPLEIGAVELPELVAEMQPALQVMLGRDIQLLTDVSPNMPPVMADPAQLRQVLLKLAANSGEAMAHRGKFRIAACAATPDDPALPSGSAGSFALLEVSDEGPGLDDESWDHLFEPFFTTRQNGKRGLGLAVVHGIVHKLGGRLWAHSEPGKGASFRIYLPLGERHPSTILLMEENEGLRTVVANILKKRGYRVLAAPAAAEALEMAKTQGPPDLLICEPQPELASSLVALHPRVRTLFLNGHTSNAGIPSIAKPFELGTLLGKVTELLAQAH